MYHFVKWEGGAYLCLGTVMAKSGTRLAKEYTFYPSYDPIIELIEDNAGGVKYPVWLWLKHLNGWLFTADVSTG